MSLTPDSTASRLTGGGGPGRDETDPCVPDQGLFVRAPAGIQHDHHDDDAPETSFVAVEPGGDVGCPPSAACFVPARSRGFL